MTEAGSPGDAGRSTDSSVSLRRLTWTAYVLMACEGYLIYAVGYINPYLQSELGAAPWAAALPNSAMAIGLLVSGFFVNRVVRALGPRATIRLWIGLMVVAAVVMWFAISIWPVVAGGLLYGIAVAGVLVHVITALSERANGVFLVRAFVWSMAGALIGPIALSAAARTVGWSWGLLVPAPVLLALLLVVPGSPARDTTAAASGHDPALGRSYWLTWLYILLGVAAEFSFVGWGSQVVIARAGLSLANATALAALFVLGEGLGRLALSAGIGSQFDLRAILRGGTLLAVVGATVLWLAGIPAAAGAGMFLGGLGIAAMYPLGTRLAIGHASHAPVTAGTRLTAASGIAIFSAPLLLGVAAGVSGVVSAWALVLAFLVAALLVLGMIPGLTGRRRPRSAAIVEVA